MALALLGESNFYLSGDKVTALYGALVIYNVGTASPIGSQVEIPVLATDTPAQFSAKLVAAINAEATRLGLANPTVAYGAGIAKVI